MTNWLLFVMIVIQALLLLLGIAIEQALKDAIAAAQASRPCRLYSYSGGTATSEYQTVPWDRTAPGVALKLERERLARQRRARRRKKKPRPRKRR